jgi:hypothetical protein
VWRASACPPEPCGNFLYHVRWLKNLAFACFNSFLQYTPIHCHTPCSRPSSAASLDIVTFRKTTNFITVSATAPPSPILSQINPVHTPPSYFLTSYLRLLHLTYFRYSHPHSARISLLSHACHINRPSRPPGCNHPTNINTVKQNHPALVLSPFSLHLFTSTP